MIFFVCNNRMIPFSMRRLLCRPLRGWFVRISTENNRRCIWTVYHSEETWSTFVIWLSTYCSKGCLHSPFPYSDVIMGTIASQITSIAIVYSTVYSSADQRKHQSSASLAFVGGIHWGPVNSPHKWPVTRKCVHLMTSSCPRVISQPMHRPYERAMGCLLWGFGRKSTAL